MISGISAAISEGLFLLILHKKYWNLNWGRTEHEQFLNRLVRFLLCAGLFEVFKPVDQSHSCIWKAANQKHNGVQILDCNSAKFLIKAKFIEKSDFKEIILKIHNLTNIFAHLYHFHEKIETFYSIEILRTQLLKVKFHFLHLSDVRSTKNSK